MGGIRGRKGITAKIDAHLGNTIVGAPMTRTKVYPPYLGKLPQELFRQTSESGSDLLMRRATKSQTSMILDPTKVPKLRVPLGVPYMDYSIMGSLLALSKALMSPKRGWSNTSYLGAGFKHFGVFLFTHVTHWHKLRDHGAVQAG